MPLFKFLELNNLETREPENYLDIVRTGNDISIKVRPSYADNVLCVGPRYQPEDFNVTFPSYLGRKASGVLRKFTEFNYHTLMSQIT